MKIFLALTIFIGGHLIGMLLDRNGLDVAPLYFWLGGMTWSLTILSLMYFK